MSDVGLHLCMCFFFSSRRRHTRFDCDWSSDCALPIFDTLEKLLGDDLVSVYVRPIERRDQSLVYAKRLHFFLSGSVKTPVSDVGKVSGDGSCGGHHGTDEMGASAASLASFKVSIAGGSTAFAGLQDVGIHTQAHRAA